MSAGTGVLRAGLWPLSLVYGWVSDRRNAAYDRGTAAAHRLDVPVISVGNLTVGGTGKTPLVVWLVEKALAAGRRPGVLARGYGRAKGAPLNDEGMLLAGRFPGLPQVQDPDRVAGGRRLLADGSVDVVILDDGFQHRRLARDTDLVCVDTASPFANGLLLPAGDLRERTRGLARASAVVLTRAGSVGDAERRSTIARVRAAAGRDLPVLVTDHRPQELAVVGSDDVRPIADLARQRVHLLSAIAKPAAFEALVRSLGAEVLVHHVRRDHHVHVPADVARLRARAEADGAILLVTEKDAVKLGAEAAGILALRIGIVFLGAEPATAEVGL
jgi:tetraacyldisaccharide 4'-kinase